MYDNTEANKVTMQKKQLPPVSIVKEDISEFYATTTDIFHVQHLYFTQKVYSTGSLIVIY